MAEASASTAEKVSLTRNERFRKLLNDEFLADVMFLVGKEKVPVKANTSILRFGSRVFYEMFDLDENAKVQNVYEVPDLEPEEFRKVLEYLYTGELKTGFKDAALMLRGAVLYDVVELVQHCLLQLVQSLSIEKCGLILPLAMNTKNKKLEYAAVDFICKLEDVSKIFNPLSDFEFTEEALMKILPMDELAIDELSLFDAIVSWGERQVARTGANADNPKLLRSVLENLIKYIRFPLMDPSDFSRRVDSTELLTVEETMSVLMYFNVKESERASYKARIFNSKPRAKPKGKTCTYCDYFGSEQVYECKQITGFRRFKCPNCKSYFLE